MADSSTTKYLKGYAEPEITIATALPQKNWARTVVVPALGEFADFPTLLNSAGQAAERAGGETLLILVINAKDSASAEAHASNEKLSDWLRTIGPEANLTGSWGFFTETSECLDLIVIDRFSVGKRLLERQGVGQARKIGCDLATALWAKGSLDSAVMDITDADAFLPADLWLEDSASPAPFAGLDLHRPVVGIHSFIHQPVDGHERAIAEYQDFLHYYYTGLKSAKSPYAFPTVGSTLRVGFEAYAQVRGFPDREAGEDFYLLNKLAKVGGVYWTGKTLQLSGRPSWRVPFGTGQQVNRLTDEYSQGRDYQIYHPAVFEKLSLFIKNLELWCVHTNDKIFFEALGELAEAGEKLGVREALGAAKKSRKTQPARTRHLHEWFDAFRTLKFIHEITATQLPKIRYQNEKV